VPQAISPEIPVPLGPEGEENHHRNLFPHFLLTSRFGKRNPILLREISNVLYYLLKEDTTIL
jgi:hypothetical protein